MKNRHGGNNVMNPRVANVMREGMQRIRATEGVFGKSVAAWRLHMRLAHILGKGQLPPSDYVLARVTDDPGYLSERRREREEAGRRQDWGRVDQIDQEFANMAPFERIYGGVIDQFKRENDSPFISAYVAERQGRAMGASGDMSSHALGGGSEEPAAGQPSRGDGGCPGGQKIGAGGACQPYSVWGLYAENSGSGDGRKKLTAPKKKIGPPPPIPAYKKEYFKSKEKQEEWRRFHEEVNQLPGVTPVEVKTYM
ncbi:MAG: hypothetical protein HQL63_13365, partial [Magnetococcales bacterium]|nr:hypothetical protein [Magnetococcales bacterium]